MQQAVISLDYALKKDENYYSQVFSKEHKYIEKKVVWHIHDNLSYFLVPMNLMFSFHRLKLSG